MNIQILRKILYSIGCEFEIIEKFNGVYNEHYFIERVNSEINIRRSVLVFMNDPEYSWALITDQSREGYLLKNKKRKILSVKELYDTVDYIAVIRYNRHEPLIFPEIGYRIFEEALNLKEKYGNYLLNETKEKISLELSIVIKKMALMFIKYSVTFLPDVGQVETLYKQTLQILSLYKSRKDSLERLQGKVVNREEFIYQLVCLEDKCVKLLREVQNNLLSEKLSLKNYSY